MGNLKSSFKFLLIILIVLIFFASNSILARMAIDTQNIDPFSFTFLRILSAMIVLFLIYFYKNKKIYISFKTNYLSGIMFFIYAICFSYSYLNMFAGIGTLILFAVVQISMIIMAIILNEKLSLNKIVGIFIAFLGLIYLLYPKEDFEISYFHTFLMFLSGFAWAIFSVLGKKSTNALQNTMDSFFKAFLIIFIYGFVYIIIFKGIIKIDYQTFVLAIVSGSLSTALGVYLWYLILAKIEIITASIIQLIIPIIAIILSIVFLNEELSINLVLSTIIILSGIFIALKKKTHNIR